MNKQDIKYIDLLLDVYENGNKKGDRTGTGTISVFDRTIRFNMQEGFPALTTKKLYYKGVKCELLWFLGNHQKNEPYKHLEQTNIKYMVDNNVNIWNEWPFQKYVKENNLNLKPNTPEWQEAITEFKTKVKEDVSFAEKWGNLGPVYGKQWMAWEHATRDGQVKYINQVQNAINDLRNNPDSRRILVEAYNVGELDKMLLQPCHYGYQLYSIEMSEKERELEFIKWCKKEDVDISYMNIDYAMEQYRFPTRKISMKFLMRSVDTLLGMPFDIASYATLLHMFAKEVDMLPWDLVCSFGDTHIYLNHLEQVKEQLSRDPYKYDAPELWLNPEVKSMFDYTLDDIKLIGYDSYPAIKAPIAV